VHLSPALQESFRSQPKSEDYAAQTIVEEVVSEDQRPMAKYTIYAIPFAEEHPECSRALFLREFNYGSPLEMAKRDTNRVDILIATTCIVVTLVMLWVVLEMGANGR